MRRSDDPLIPAIHNCAPNAKPWVLLAAILASGITYVDGTVVNVALPAIETDLAASVVVIQWVVNAYTLCLSAFLLAGGAAGDLLGRRRIFVVGVGTFAIASVWCSLSPNITQLIFARAIQGVGAALLIRCSLAIIGATFDEAERGKAIGTWSGFSAVAAAVGPLLGGWIVDHSIWRWIFLINPFIALPTIWIALYHLPESRNAKARGGLDWRGSILAFVGLGSLAFGLISAPVYGWGSATVLAALLMGLLLLAAFIWEERHSRAPMLPLELFRSRTFSAVNVLTLFLYAALAGAFFFLPFALIQVEGFSAVLAGAVFLPLTLIMAALSRWSGGLLDRFGAKWLLVIGPTIASLGFGLLALSVGSGSYWTYLVPVTVIAFGMVITVAPSRPRLSMLSLPIRRASPLASTMHVASVASLLAVAMLGALALGIYGRALDSTLEAKSASGEVKQAIEVARRQFVTAPALASVQGNDREVAETIIKGSLAESIRMIMVVSAGLALAGAASGALLPRSHA